MQKRVGSTPPSADAVGGPASAPAATAAMAIRLKFLKIATMSDSLNAFLRANLRLLAVLSALTAALATPAFAVHWPQQGGDAGRSGYQPVGDGAAPVRELWSVEADVVT